MSKRTGTASGVIHRDHSTSSASAPSSIPVSSASSRAAQAAAVSPFSIIPPGKTQTPGMNEASVERRTISTSTPESP